MSHYAMNNDMSAEDWNNFDKPHKAPFKSVDEAAKHFEDSVKRLYEREHWRGRAICEEALRTINGERQDQYGNPEDTFTRIAHLWTAYLSGDGDVIHIMPPMVADMMCLLKIARESGGKGKKDNMVDIIGYAALGASLRGYDA